MNFYSGVGLAQKDYVIYHVLSTFIVSNDTEAKGYMLEKVMSKFPENEGYINYKVTILPADQETLTEVYNDVIKPNIVNYENR